MGVDKVSMPVLPREWKIWPYGQRWNIMGIQVYDFRFTVFPVQMNCKAAGQVQGDTNGIIFSPFKTEKIRPKESSALRQ